MKKVINPFKRSIFLDSAKIDEIEKWNETGVIDGVTSNQAIMHKDGVKAKDFKKVVKKICKIMKDGPVSVELSDSTASPQAMVKEAKQLNEWAKNIVVKVPVIPGATKSLWVINKLAKANIAVNVTVMMTYEQMIMGALAARNCKRPSFLSLFWGRSLEDQVQYRSRADFMAQFPRVGIVSSEVDSHPKNITKATAEFLNEGGYDNLKIIIGSIRNAVMVGESFAAGAHIVTITPEILQSMLFSQRSIETIKQFDDAWKDLQAGK